MRDAIALAEHEIIAHQAGDYARNIIRKHSSHERSSFLGLAIANERKLMGFKNNDLLLALFNVNVNDFKTLDEARAQIYHLTWHAIDLYEIRQDPLYKKKFKSGPMVPKRSPINLAKANLQADSFAIIYSHLCGEEKVFDILRHKRALESISPIANFQPENYPTTIAMEACQFAIEAIEERYDSKNLEQNKTPFENLHIAKSYATDIGMAFDEHNIRQWWDFTTPAQDMAWRDMKKDLILGSAIHTSDNPYVRSVALLVEENGQLTPASRNDVQQIYNAFIDPSILSKTHYEMVDTIFEDAMHQGLEESSGRAFLNAANRLNENLTEGRILGWCANALQDAASAFEKALTSGASPDQAARMHFEGNKDNLKWDTLKKLGGDIIQQKQKGFAVTMGHIAEICHNNPAFTPVLGSIKMTMNDPSYVQKLDASNDFRNTNIPTPPSHAPSAPAPKGPAPNAPALSNAPRLGGSLFQLIVLPIGALCACALA